MTTTPVKIKRTNGAVVTVDIHDAPHYEIVLFQDDPDPDKVYERYEVVLAQTAAEARRIGKTLAVGTEEVAQVHKMSRGETALRVLNGLQVVAER